MAAATAAMRDTTSSSLEDTLPRHHGFVSGFNWVRGPVGIVHGQVATLSADFLFEKSLVVWIPKTRSLDLIPWVDPCQLKTWSPLAFYIARTSIAHLFALSAHFSRYVVGWWQWKNIPHFGFDFFHFALRTLLGP
ncbi:hypothetical protein MKZ38_006603 [Zalerion maritima]|uniref:Uncharacterized protein n=1 Tax=Zalerion maritima TaxID=339359 RepID=A0AAD5RJ16_9PEZI|nr:hypothetical protein MKZ38_006603 [Zalerion maritima]